MTKGLGQAGEVFSQAIGYTPAKLGTGHSPEPQILVSRMNDTTRANVKADRRAKLFSARLYALTDGAENRDEFAHRITAMVAGGVDIIQFREKRPSTETIVDRIQLALEIIRGAGGDVLFIVNDRADLAAQYPVDGVHVGQDDMTALLARKTIGSGKLLGVSTHDIRQARQAVSDGADYLGAGPTFPSRTKRFEAFPGLDFLTQVSSFDIPVFAIGGIKQQNIDAVFATGITRIAVSDAIVGAEDIRGVVRSLQAQLATL